MPTQWNAKGLLFENCSCQLICPAHISFKSYCNNDRCRGHWAFHIDEGRYDGVALDGLNMVVVFDSPIQMYSGNWTQAFYIDERADTAPAQCAGSDLLGQGGRAVGDAQRLRCHTTREQIRSDAVRRSRP